MRKKKVIRTFLWCIAFILIVYGLIQIAVPMIEYTNEINTTSAEMDDFIASVESGQEETSVSEVQKPEFTGNMVGLITIDSIHLQAPIAYGTSEDVLHQYVGMYEELDDFSTEGGVVGLAAHSTRFTSPCAYCYFQNTSDIQEGDIIHILWKDGSTYKYVVYDIVTWQEENTPGMFDKVEGKSILVLQTCTNGQHGIRSYVHAERVPQ